MAEKDAFTRDDFLRRTAAAGVAVAGGTLWATAPAAARAGRYGKAQGPLRHVVISCQENRSFDHYFGYAPQVQAAGFGPPPGYTQPDAAGGTHAPFELTPRQSPHPPHHWGAVHSPHNGGRMGRLFPPPPHDNGDGHQAPGYYTG